MRQILNILLFLLSFTCLAAPVKVAIIDTGLKQEFMQKVPLCSSGHKDFTGEGFDDFNGHGTNVIGLIVSEVKDLDYCVVLIKAYAFKNHEDPISYFPEALNYLAELKVSIVNLSGGGQGFSVKEYEATENLLKSGAKLIVAAGNESADLDKNCDYYPGCYDDRIYLIGNFNKSSNYGKKVDSIVDGNNKSAFGVTRSGTSQSTAIFTNLLLKSLAKNKKKK